MPYSLAITIAAVPLANMWLPYSFSNSLSLIAGIDTRRMVSIPMQGPEADVMRYTYTCIMIVF
jgi:hypothetical protein